MEFKKCQVGPHVYGDPTEEDLQNEAAQDYTGMITSSVDEIKSQMDWHFKEKRAKEDRKFKAQFQEMQKPPGVGNGDKLYRFFRLLAVCHTVVVDKNPDTGEI